MSAPLFHNAFHMFVGLETTVHVGLLVQKVLFGPEFNLYLLSSSFNNLS